MTSHALRLLLFVLCLTLWSGAFYSAVAQESGKTHLSSTSTSTSTRKDGRGDRIYRRDPSPWNWNRRGRTVPRGESAAGLRFRAYQQKMAMRAAHTPSESSFSTDPPKQSLDGAPANSTPPPMSSSPHPLIAKGAMSGAPASAAVSTAWTSLGPAPLASDATGDGGQDYNWVSGRATSVLIDPRTLAETRCYWAALMGSLEIDQRGKSESQSRCSCVATAD